jgi:hypothetical protein
MDSVPTTTKENAVTKVDLKYEVTPMDLAILAELPDEDQMLGFNYVGKQVSHLVRVLTHKAGVDTPSPQIQARLRTMKLNGLSVDRPGVSSGGKRIWQRTPLGKQVLDERGEPTPGAAS